jgi:hypothetical protein
LLSCDGESRTTILASAEVDAVECLALGTSNQAFAEGRLTFRTLREEIFVHEFTVRTTLGVVDIKNSASGARPKEFGIAFATKGALQVFIVELLSTALACADQIVLQTARWTV